ncbi:MAG: VWA domain-containing protein [Lachnospiraceae bacterium]|nr:VWA domain-containing protein [Lachnospiraceae bacterium]
MFCSKCGNQLKEGVKFCPACGNATGNQSPSHNKEINQPVVKNVEQTETMKSQGKAFPKIIIILGLLFVIAGLLCAAGFLFFRSETKDSEDLTFEGQLKKAEEYMEQKEYEDAIGYYKAALKMDDEAVDVYIDMAKAYVELEDFTKAQKILETGLEITDSKKIKDYLDKIIKQSSGEDISEETEEVYTGEKTDINIEVRQVDNSKFPEITLYASVTDMTGNTITKLDKTDFDITEIDQYGNIMDASIDDVYQVLNEDNINVNLVLDASGSMDTSSKMQKAKNAANAFVDQIEMTKGDKVEVISFDDFVYLEQDFSSQKDLVTNAISSITTGGMTALYDAIYAGLFQTYYQEGAKCVIAFTDGLENSSSYTYNDVVDMAKNTGIPVFIIGIGEEYDMSELQELATQCSGKYYSADVQDLETILEDIYISIYREQQDYYVVKYTADDRSNVTQFRDVVLETSKSTEFSGSYRKSYVPQADISGAFSDSYMNVDYILDFSSQSAVNENDLAGLSLAELRLARNEIFARHGRQFRDSMLNQWFYSKVWYLNISQKYSPDDFDRISPSPLSKLESDNANFIKAYEQEIMSTQDIFPNANSIVLSEYDLALSKPVLKTALEQMRTYTETDVLKENIQLVQDAINKEDVQY